MYIERKLEQKRLKLSQGISLRTTSVGSELYNISFRFTILLIMWHEGNYNINAINLCKIK